MIGFTLGGYAIMLSFSADKLGNLLASEKFDGRSDYIQVSTTFFHFVLVEIIALIACLIALALNEISLSAAASDLGLNFPNWLKTISIIILLALNFLGQILFFYSITLAFAALFAIYRLSGIVDLALTTTLISEAESEQSVDKDLGE